MKVEVEKLTDVELLKKCMKHIFGVDVKARLGKWYDSGHSPARTQMFAIYCEDIPYCVCMQMRTHDKNGALFLVESGRPDTGSAKEHNRMAPRKMFIMCNAQHLIDWSHKRMCTKAEVYTRKFFNLLKDEIEKVDPELSACLEPMCIYRGGICGEFKPCGFNMAYKGLEHEQ